MHGDRGAWRRSIATRSANELSDVESSAILSPVLVPHARDLEFRPPRPNYEVDVDRIVAAVPGGATTKGMFINRTLRLARGIDDETILAQAGVELQRFIPFRDYAWRDFFRIAHTVARLRSPELPDNQRLREVGHAYHPAFAESLAGKLLFGRLMRSPSRVLDLAPKAWAMSSTLGALRAESMGDCHYRHHIDGIPLDVTESVLLGVLEGSLIYCDVEAEIAVAVLAEDRAVFDIRWTETD